jgi:hypothetical protein
MVQIRRHIGQETGQELLTKARLACWTLRQTYILIYTDGRTNNVAKDPKPSTSTRLRGPGRILPILILGKTELVAL